MGTGAGCRTALRAPPLPEVDAPEIELIDDADTARRENLRKTILKAAKRKNRRKTPPAAGGGKPGPIGDSPTPMEEEIPSPGVTPSPELPPSDLRAARDLTQFLNHRARQSWRAPDFVQA